MKNPLRKTLKTEETLKIGDTFGGGVVLKTGQPDYTHSCDLPPSKQGGVLWRCSTCGMEWGSSAPKRGDMYAQWKIVRDPRMGWLQGARAEKGQER